MVRWRLRGRDVAMPRQHRSRRRLGPCSPAIGCSPATSDGTDGKRRAWGIWGSPLRHPYVPGRPAAREVCGGGGGAVWRCGGAALPWPSGRGDARMGSAAMRRTWWRWSRGRVVDGGGARGGGARAADGDEILRFRRKESRGGGVGEEEGMRWRRRSRCSYL